MSGEASIESGRLGRIAVIRLKPNQDLVGGVEAACRDNGMSHAVVRSAVGSLVDSVLAYGKDGTQREFKGPGIEILTLAGEVRPDSKGLPQADLRGTISEPSAKVHGGGFVRGENPICITLELVLQEWIPA